MKVKNLMACIMSATFLAVAANAYAETETINYQKPTVQEEVNQEEGISPYFLVFIDCWVGLKDEGNGKLLCSGGTLVRDGYTAGTLMELQRQENDGSWTTVKSWTGKGGSQKGFDKNWYVASGLYRVKVTHQAYEGNSLIEIFTSYSSNVRI